MSREQLQRLFATAVAAMRRAWEWFAAHVPLPGRLTIVLGLASWYVAAHYGWAEFATVAGACVVALLVAALFMLGRDRIEITIDLHPGRVVVGETAGGSIHVRNELNRRILPFRIEAPIGANLLRADVPSLGPGGDHEEPFVIPTRRRSIVPVGPARSVRGDPLGLLRREVAFTDPLELYVHPKTAMLSGLTSGWIRDLEGLSTLDLSPSDIELHTLREYVPGDDRRHVHWRTTARIGTLMVRQFVDTRRSHLAVILCTGTGEFAGEDEFELAVSLAGSLGVRALRDEQELTFVAGGTPLPTPSSRKLLDGLSGVVFGEGPGAINAVVSEAARAVTSASVIAVVTGSATDIPTIRRAVHWLPSNLRVIAVRAALGKHSVIRPVGATTVLDIADLDALQPLLAAAGGL